MTSEAARAASSAGEPVVQDWAIIYLRPDGWWHAGDGFESEAEAREAAESHNWGSAPWAGEERWRVVPTSDLYSHLCSDGIVDLDVG